MQTIEPTARSLAREPHNADVVGRPAFQAGEPVISVKNASKRFGKGEPTVHDLNFEVQRGQIFCLLGSSGSGKSTTMRMLTGVYRPTEGEVRVLGAVPSRFKKRTRTRMGYLPQQFVLFPELTTLENMNFMASIYGMSWFGRRKKVREALEFVDLWEARKRLASQLSGGMQRRLELASVLIHKPDLIFVDEPTAGIDPILRAKFWEHFKNLRDEGRTIFVTTQYVTEADYCDVVAILSRGKLLALGTPEAIRREAMGGEIVKMALPEVTSQTVRLLRGLPGMRRIKIVSTEELSLTVADATESLREILELFERNQIEIQSIQPYRPDFEEVFVQLMEQDALAHPEEQEEDKHKDKDKDKHKHQNHDEPPEKAINKTPSLLNSNSRPNQAALPAEAETMLEETVRQDPLSQPQPVADPEENERRAEIVQAIAPDYRPDMPVQAEIVQPTPMSQAYPAEPPVPAQLDATMYSQPVVVDETIPPLNMNTGINAQRHITKPLHKTNADTSTQVQE